MRQRLGLAAALLGDADKFNKRANDFQLRIADQITRFDGSIGFVYLHIVLFAVCYSIVAQRPTTSIDAHD